jgi:uroporphyrinogen-III decarboxylase
MRDYAEIIRSHGRRAFLHMCGHLRDLLPQLAELDYDAFEAFTSPPLGNCTLSDGRTQLPSIALIGGTNAIDWASGADAVIEALERDLADMPSHRGVVVTSGGAMPPQVEPESIRRVVEWVKAQTPRW